MVLLLAVLAVVSGVGVALLLRTGSSVAAGADLPAAPPTPRAAPADDGAAPSRRAELQALLDRRAAAVLARDVDALLADVAPDDADLRRRQAAWLAGLPEDLPLSAYAYEVTDGAGAGPSVTLTYALAGFDDDPVRTRSPLVLGPAGDRPVVLDDGLAGRWSPDPLGRAQQRQDAAASSAGAGDEAPDQVDLVTRADAGVTDPGTGAAGRVPLWELGPVTVSRSGGVLALSHVGAEALRDAWRDDLVDAVGRVRAAWPGTWSATVVLLVPADAVDAAVLIGDGTDLTGVAAVATSLLDPSLEPGAPGWATGERVVVDPVAMTRLPPLAQDVVLTHETVHVATRAATGPRTPLWLAEGYADHVAYSSLGVHLARGAPTLAARVRAGRLPEAPPEAEAFRAPPPPGPELVYETAWSLVDHLARAAGEDAVVGLYADLARPDADLEPAVRARTGGDLDRLVADWRASLPEALR